jgi:hypothetical protein
MSDQEVCRALDAMEQMLRDGSVTVTAVLKPWQERYDAAMASAHRGPGWAEIAERAHYLGRRVDSVLAGALADRDAIQKELRLMAMGRRALKGYKPAKN